MRGKVDKPTNYHTFLTADKVFETPFKYGYGWLVELECGHVVEFAETTQKEKQLREITGENLIFCAKCKAESKTKQPEEIFYKPILRYRRVKIGKEGA